MPVRIVTGGVVGSSCAGAFGHCAMIVGRGHAPVLCAGDLPVAAENTRLRLGVICQAARVTETSSYNIDYSGILEGGRNACNYLILLVGPGRFARPTPCAQGRCDLQQVPGKWGEHVSLSRPMAPGR